MNLLILNEPLSICGYQSLSKTEHPPKPADPTLPVWAVARFTWKELLVSLKKISRGLLHQSFIHAV